MEKLTEKVDPDKTNLNSRFMYCCRNCNNVEYKPESLPNEKCPICEHRYDLPTKMPQIQQNI